MQNFDRNLFFNLLVGSDYRMRLIRYFVLWTTALYLIYTSFQFLSGTLPDYSDEAATRYTLLATFFFGTLTILGYWIITYLSRQYILFTFRPILFTCWIFVIHIIASELTFWHFILFAKYITLPHLPRYYSIYDDYFRELSLWQVPIDNVVVWTFAFSFFYNYLLYVVALKVFKDLFTLRVRQNELEKANLKLEFEFLKSQVNPHFLFNTLNNIYSFSISSPDKVPDTILKLSDMMRYSLYETNEEYVSLQKEIDFLTSYIDLERIRHDDNVRIDFTISGQSAGRRVPPLLFILFVENAFKHGVQSSAQLSWVDIRLDIVDHSIRFTISNSVPLKKMSKIGGLGLKNVRKRLDYFYPQRYTLEINEQSTTFKVNLLLQTDGKDV